MDESKFLLPSNDDHNLFYTIYFLEKCSRTRDWIIIVYRISIYCVHAVLIEKWSCEKAKLNPSQAISQMIFHACYIFVFVRKQQQQKEEEGESAMASNGIQFIV